MTDLPKDFSLLRPRLARQKGLLDNFWSRLPRVSRCRVALQSKQVAASTICGWTALEVLAFQGIRSQHRERTTYPHDLSQECAKRALFSLRSVH